jgi:5-methylcytosine-specific restriction protein A
MADYVVKGRDLLLFETLGSGEVRFLGQFDCGGYSFQLAPDQEGVTRTSIVSDLVPTNDASSATEP